MDAIDVIKNPPKLVTKSIEVINKEKARQEALELIVSCAKDVVDFWPQFSFKTIRIMVSKMENLKQALEMLPK